MVSQAETEDVGLNLFFIMLIQEHCCQPRNWSKNWCEIAYHWLSGAPSCRCERCGTVVPASGPCTRTSPGLQIEPSRCAGRTCHAGWFDLWGLEARGETCTYQQPSPRPSPWPLVPALFTFQITKRPNRGESQSDPQSFLTVPRATSTNIFNRTSNPPRHYVIAGWRFLRVKRRRGFMPFFWQQCRTDGRNNISTDRGIARQQSLGLLKDCVKPANNFSYLKKWHYCGKHMKTGSQCTM